METNMSEYFFPHHAMEVWQLPVVSKVGKNGFVKCPTTVNSKLSNKIYWVYKVN